MIAVQDKYPSRAGRPACLVPRLDPVAYASAPQRPLADLPAGQVAQYERDGYLVLHDVFSDGEVQCFRDELERLRKDASLAGRDELISEPGSGDIRSIFRVHRISQLFSHLASDVRLAGIAQRLLDDEVYIHQSRLNYKPGFRGKEFYWHSDFETWHVEDGMPAMRALSMSITLTENTPHNGPLMLMPGSHKFYAVCTGETPANHFRKSLKRQEYGVPEDDLLAQLAGRNGIVSAVARPGSVILFDCNIMHGSNSNITPDPRSNAFFVYNAISNRVVQPFCDRSPRPEYIAAREHIEVIQAQPHGPESYRDELQAV
ncbi:MAG: ectoine hydroxylase [Gallionella sp.]